MSRVPYGIFYSNAFCEPPMGTWESSRNPLRSPKQESLATMYNCLIFGVLIPSWALYAHGSTGSPCSWSPHHLPTGVCPVSRMLMRQELQCPLSTALQHWHALCFLFINPISFPAPSLRIDFCIGSGKLLFCLPASHANLLSIALNLLFPLISWPVLLF